MTEYMLVTDNDTHWYVIPSDMEDDFYDQVYPDGFDDEVGDIPDYATAVNGSMAHVKFTGFRIKR